MRWKVKLNCLKLWEEKFTGKKSKFLDENCKLWDEKLKISNISVKIMRWKFKIMRKIQNHETEGQNYESKSQIKLSQIRRREILGRKVKIMRQKIDVTVHWNITEVTIFPSAITKIIRCASFSDEGQTWQNNIIMKCRAAETSCLKTRNMFVCYRTRQMSHRHDYNSFIFVCLTILRCIHSGECCRNAVFRVRKMYSIHPPAVRPRCGDVL